MTEHETQAIAKQVIAMLGDYLREEVTRQVQLRVDYEIQRGLERGINTAVRARIVREVEEQLVISVAVKGGA